MHSNGLRRFAGDDGAADRDVADTLAAYAAGRATEQAALAALSSGRLLVPLVEREATADDAGDAHEGHEHGNEFGHEHGAKEMAMPRLIGADGRPAVLAFTSAEALAGWRRDARPVPTDAREVWSTAVEDSCAVVIDVAGPVPLAVEGARLAALAAGEPAPAPYADPDVRAHVMAAITNEPGISGAELAEGPPGADLAVRLVLADPAPDHGAGTPAGGPDDLDAATSAALRRAAETIAGGLAGRLRRGIEVSAVARKH